MRSRRIILIFTLGSFLAACDRPASTNTTASTSSLPRAISAFHDWHGFKIVRGDRCPDCCSLEFPKDFGSNKPEELKLLQEMVNARNIERDVPCVRPIAYDAMNHLLKLATQRQDKGAAALIMYPDGHGGLDFGGGDLAEAYGATYLVPVLLGYNNLSDILNTKAEKHIAETVCAARHIFVGDVDFTLLMKNLKEKKADSLATQIVDVCKTYEPPSQSK